MKLLGVWHLSLLLAGCGARVAPVPAPTPPLAPAIPAAAVPTSVYTSYPNGYVVALCIDLDGINWLCWPPPEGD
jgi:hypothetical protein